MLLLSPGELIVCPSPTTLWRDVESSQDLGILEEGDIIFVLGERKRDVSGVSLVLYDKSEAYMLTPVLSRLGVGWIWSRAFETR